jgi:hypothetical protein
MAADGERLVNQSLTYEIDNVMIEAIATNLFTSLATIQSPDLEINPDGTTTGTGSNTYSNVYVDIPCMDTAPSSMRVQATEVRDLQEIMSKGFRHVLLNQYFADAPAVVGNPVQPGWSGKGYRMIVDGIPYTILGGENDSQNQMTRVELQLVTV